VKQPQKHIAVDTVSMSEASNEASARPKIMTCGPALFFAGVLTHRHEYIRVQINSRALDFV
jgi:hypothetical protein